MSGTVYSVSEPLVAGVKHFEGYYARPYLCPTGYPTIGYGHVIKSSEKETLTHLTEPEATALLRKDLNESLKEALRIMPGLARSQQQLDAITSWVFNLGAANLQNSTLKKLYVSGHHDQAAAEITRWVYGKVNGKMVQLPGLVRRRAWEKKVFLDGNYTL